MLLALLLMQSTPSAANQADLRCLASFALSASDSLTAEQRAGLSSAATYFVGRIDARTANFDYEAAFVDLFSRPDALAAIDADRQRCAALVQDRGSALQALGRALKRRAGQGN
ncbi:hypothetical protein GGR88_002470 [Sphingomonas jejuensis]|uniref:Uncharacterized protein n=1 Tax=Sphingomonas jejuensis TaxID=904715 RepID=A0ABX0XQI0_9SPHN|nr:hypothetical protein [Sphingomonas jejuensis]NJC34956.1 hypothetical protein [Sphingomonas jejuensis]